MSRITWAGWSSAVSPLVPSSVPLGHQCIAYYIDRVVVGSIAVSTVVSVASIVLSLVCLFEKSLVFNSSNHRASMSDVSPGDQTQACFILPPPLCADQQQFVGQASVAVMYVATFLVS